MALRVKGTAQGSVQGPEVLSQLFTLSQLLPPAELRVLQNIQRIFRRLAGGGFTHGGWQ